MGESHLLYSFASQGGKAMWERRGNKKCDDEFWITISFSKKGGGKGPKSGATFWLEGECPLATQWEGVAAGRD